MTRFAKKAVGGASLRLGLLGFATAGVAGYQMNMNTENMNTENAAQHAAQRLPYVVVKNNSENAELAKNKENAALPNNLNIYAVLRPIEWVVKEKSNMANHMHEVCKDPKENLHVYAQKMIFLCANENDRGKIEKLLPRLQHPWSDGELEEQTTLDESESTLKPSQSFKSMDAKNYDMQWQNYAFTILGFQKKGQEQKVQKRRNQRRPVKPVKGCKFFANLGEEIYAGINPCAWCLGKFLCIHRCGCSNIGYWSRQSEIAIEELEEQLGRLNVEAKEDSSYKALLGTKLCCSRYYIFSKFARRMEWLQATKKSLIAKLLAGNKSWSDLKQDEKKLFPDIRYADAKEQEKMWNHAKEKEKMHVE